jgi:hypothetical protein
VTRGSIRSRQAAIFSRVGPATVRAPATATQPASTLIRLAPPSTTSS